MIKADTILDYSVKENIAERVAKKLGAEVANRFAPRLFDSGSYR